MTTKGRPPFRAVIVGGSIAGLTLAHAFEQAGIEYELLERRDNIAPNLGATHFIWPNGATILDQLGLWENMDPIMNPMRHTVTTTAPGRSNPTADYLSILEARYVIVRTDDDCMLIFARLGYTISVVERRSFLQSLFDQLKNKQNVHLNKDVDSATRTDDGVLIRCRDGSKYYGVWLLSFCAISE
jgi:FAD dependent monooxygenase